MAQFGSSLAWAESRVTRKSSSGTKKIFFPVIKTGDKLSQTLLREAICLPLKQARSSLKGPFLDLYQMTRSGSDNAVNINSMKHLNSADITTSYGVLRIRAAVVIAAIMAVLVFVGGANAHHNGETEVPQRTEIEA